ncbi:MAG: hypothetical protein KDC54_17515, partial [Lewinella sp.]|nr:hypothetical protein [Lewinella sp.]
CSRFPEAHIINRPTGIWTTSSKRFLLNFPELCPPMAHCRSVDDILAFRDQQAMVLKPLRSYGGQGIIRIDGDRAWLGLKELSLDRLLEILDQQEVDYLAMAYLSQVGQGDKRVIVVNGQVLGGVLRVPAADSWLCNAAQGGRAEASEADADEQAIAARLTPTLREHGILIYGFDTLVNDDGHRVLSEINTMSIGGMPQMAALSGRPIVEQVAEHIWEYVNQSMYGLAS